MRAGMEEKEEKREGEGVRGEIRKRRRKKRREKKVMRRWDER